MVRELLAEYGHLEFHETLLGLLGTSAIRCERVSQHLVTLAEIFDRARRAIKTQLVFASDINEMARTIAIDGSLELIRCGYHREAMFWIGVTHSGCQKVLSLDAPRDLTQRYKDSYQELVSDIGVPTVAKIRHAVQTFSESSLDCATWRQALSQQTTKLRTIDIAFGHVAG